MRQNQPRTKTRGTGAVQRLRQRIRELERLRRAYARTAERLRESEERFRGLSQASMEGIVIHDGKKILAINRRAARMFGYSMKDLIGRNPLDLAAPESRKKVRENIRKNYRNPYTAVGVRKDGTTFPGRLQGKPVRYRGKPARVVAIRDITQEKEYKQTLEESEARYRTLFLSAAEGIFVVDANTKKILLANPAATRMFGCTRQEFHKMNLGELHPEGYRNRILSVIDRRARGRKPQLLEIPSVRSDGTVFFADIAIRRSLIDRKECGIAFYAEATERKKSREKLVHLNKVLRAIRMVNQLITKEKNRDRLIRGTCSNLVRTFGYGSAWIVLFDEEGQHISHAQAGFDEKTFRPMARLLEQNRLPECAKKAIGERKILAIRDPMRACRDCPLKDHYNGKGPMLIRLESRKKVYGLLSVSIPLEFLSEREERSLFREVAGDLSFAFSSIDLEQERQRAEARMREAREFAASIVETVREPLLVLDRDLRVVSANRSFYRTFKVSRRKTLGRKIYELGEREWDIPKLRELLEEILPQNTSFENFEVRHEFPRIGPKTFLLNARRVYREKNKTQMILLAIEDISERSEREEERRDYEKKLRLLASQLAWVEEQERRRLSALLHDEIGQSLALAKIRLDALKDVPDISEALRVQLEEIGRALKETIQETRSLSFELSPPMMHEFGIANSLKWLLNLYQSRFGLQAKFRDDRKPKPIREDLHIVLFQAVRELLMNVVKHADVHSVLVSTRRVGGNVEIRVRDRGKGFDPKEVQPYSLSAGGFGLFNIRERLREYGGSLVLRSRPGKGTSVTLRVPLSS